MKVGKKRKKKNWAMLSSKKGKREKPTEDYD